MSTPSLKLGSRFESLLISSTAYSMASTPLNPRTWKTPRHDVFPGWGAKLGEKCTGIRAPSTISPDIKNLVLFFLAIAADSWKGNIKSIAVLRRHRINSLIAYARTIWLQINRQHCLELSDIRSFLKIGFLARPLDIFFWKMMTENAAWAKFVDLSSNQWECPLTLSAYICLRHVEENDKSNNVNVVVAF